MSDKGYKWRNNPAVIAKYVHDRDVPKGAEVTLKPNEACVVVEDGRISGIATQKHMEVNPELVSYPRCSVVGIQSEHSFSFS